MGLSAISGVSRVYFGGPGDRPVPADYTKDGGCDIALFRDDLGRWAIRGHSRIYFGAPGDTSVPAPYYPNVNRSLCAVFRASTGLWWIRGVSRFYFGGGSDRPVPGQLHPGRVLTAGRLRRRFRTLGDPRRLPVLLWICWRHTGHEMSIG